MPGQTEPESNGNEGVLCIPQSPSITGKSPLDCLVSYAGHSLGAVLLLCRGAVSVFYSPSRLGKLIKSVIENIIISISSRLIPCPIGWDSRIHWLHLRRGVRHPPAVTGVLIWHSTIWWWGSSKGGALGNAEYPFIAIALRSTRTRKGSTW